MGTPGQMSERDGRKFIRLIVPIIYCRMKIFLAHLIEEQRELSVQVGHQVFR